MSRRLPLGRLSGVRRLSAESRLTGKRQISNEAAPHATTTLSFLGSHIVGVVCLRREMPHKFTELAWRAFLANWRAARLRASAQPSKSHRASAIDLECGAQSNWRARNWNRAHFCQTHTRQKCSLSFSGPRGSRLLLLLAARRVVRSTLAGFTSLNLSPVEAGSASSRALAAGSSRAAAVGFGGGRIGEQSSCRCRCCCLPFAVYLRLFITQSNFFSHPRAAILRCRRRRLALGSLSSISASRSFITPASRRRTMLD